MVHQPAAPTPPSALSTLECHGLPLHASLQAGARKSKAALLPLQTLSLAGLLYKCLLPSLLDPSHPRPAGRVTVGKPWRPREAFAPPELYSIHRGEVKSVQEFGAFVSLEGLSTKDGLVHVSQLKNPAVRYCPHMLLLSRGDALPALLNSLVAVSCSLWQGVGCRPS